MWWKTRDDNLIMSNNVAMMYKCTWLYVIIFMLHFLKHMYLFNATQTSDSSAFYRKMCLHVEAANKNLWTCYTVLLCFND